MRNFKNIIAIFVIISAAFFMSPAFAWAQSPASAPASADKPVSSDLQALIKQLQDQIKALQKQVVDLQTKLDVSQKETAVVKEEAKATREEVRATKEEVKTAREEVQAIREELKLTKFLRRGESGEEVKKLQEFLAQRPDLYPEGLVTGIFGPRTEAAVRKLQEKYGFESVGFIGPKTLSKINELLNQGAGVSGVIPPGLLQAPGIEKKVPAVSSETGLATSTTVKPVSVPVEAAVAAVTATTTAATSTTASVTAAPTPVPEASAVSVSSSPTSAASVTTTITSSSVSTATTTATSSPAFSVYDVRASGTSHNTTTIYWLTSVPADDKVEYGPTLSYVYSRVGTSTSLVASHAVTLLDLAGSTTYHYRVTSKDASGNSISSSDYTFTTTAPMVPPVISNVQATVTENSATITWTTDKAANSQVDYGVYSYYGYSTSYSPLVTSHSVTIPGLPAGTIYNYRVVSQDVPGNGNASQNYTFTTASPQLAPLSSALISHWKFDGNGNNEVSGAPAAQIVGNAVFNSSGGKFGGYAYIPTGSDSVKIPYNSMYDLPNDFSIEFWFRQRANRSFFQDLVYKGLPMNNYNFRVFRQLWNEYNFGPIIAGSTAAGTGYWHQASNSNQLAHGEWHHVVYTRNTSVAAYYLDGAVVHTNILSSEYTGPAKTPAVDIIIGDSAVDTDIDNLKIYNRVMTSGEVQSNMQQAGAVKSVDTQLADIASAISRISEAVKKLLDKR
ncbi:MAG: peptidoglycan-binding protein [Candidatus Sungbacteria bacterium]|nr:peptidoglycan-binding protein [Candidatus Sungbacteria bacterium]